MNCEKLDIDFINGFIYLLIFKLKTYETIDNYRKIIIWFWEIEWFE